MNQQEAAALLGVAAAFDNRKPDADAATAWSVALDGLRFEDCRDAIVAHYRASSEWLMPQAVIAHVRRIREKRIADYGPIPAPAHIDPDDTLAYQRYLRGKRQSIADGEEAPPPPALEPTPMPEGLARQIDSFGRLPDDRPTTTQEEA